MAATITPFRPRPVDDAPVQPQPGEARHILAFTVDGITYTHAFMDEVAARTMLQLAERLGWTPRLIEGGQAR